MGDDTDLGGWLDGLMEGYETPTSQGQNTPPVSSPSPPETQEDGKGHMGMATGLVNDLIAGTQGVNPSAVLETMPIGRVTSEGDKPFITFWDDNKRFDPEDLPQDRFIIMKDPKTGDTNVYARTPDLEDSAGTSLGRLAGFTTGGVASFAKGPVKEAAKMAKEFTDLGVRQPPSTVSAGAQFAEDTGASFITTQGPIERGRQAVDESLAAAHENIRSQIGKGTPSTLEAGEALLAGAKNFKTEFQKRSASLYDAVKIRPSTPVSIDNTKIVFEKFANKMESTPALGKFLNTKKYKDMLNQVDELEADGGSLTWGELSELRTSIGEMLGDPLSKAPVAKQQLRQLYGALSDDMGAAAKASGKSAHKAWQRANKHFSQGSEVMEQTLDFLLKKDSTGEKAIYKTLSMAKNAGTQANYRKLKELKKAMPDDNWRTVMAGVVGDMGTVKQADGEGVFVLDGFLKQWSGLSEAGKDIMFGAGRSQLKGSLQKLANVSEKIKNSRGRVADINNNYQILGLAVAGMSAPTTTASVALSSNVMSRLFMSPRFVSALNHYVDHGKTGVFKSLTDKVNSPLAPHIQKFVSSLEQAEASKESANDQ